MTLSIFLILYTIIVAAFFVHALLNLFHVLRFGHLDAKTYFMTGAFIVGFLFIVFVSYRFISDIDWQRPIFSFNAQVFPSQTIKTGF